MRKWILVTRNDEEEMFSRIEADQRLINGLIEDSKRLSARSDALMSSARNVPRTKCGARDRTDPS